MQPARGSPRVPRPLRDHRPSQLVATRKALLKVPPRRARKGQRDVCGPASSNLYHVELTRLRSARHITRMEGQSI
eukprot:2140664-Pleurochrysis_carterae.AAC.1